MAPFDPVEATRDLVRHPSVSTDPAFAGGMAACRRELVTLFEGFGLDTEVVETAGHPLILARRTGAQAWPHVLVYGHYDVQPPDPLDEWDTEPFEPVEKEGFLYGRGAADNKGPFMVHVAGLAQALAEEPDLPLRVTFLIEGEEEIGSPSLAPLLRERAGELSADCVLLSDTLSPSPERIAITTGLRGIAALEVRVAGPRSDLHSGIHGGAVYNPVRALTELCASLHDADGRVNVPGFYDDVVPPADWEREEIARLGVSAEEYARSLGVPALDAPDGLGPVDATRLGPTLEFNGIGGGYQGTGSKTIIPASAFVKISCRLVADQDPDRIRDLVVAALRERCPPQVRLEIEEHHGGAAYLVVPPGRPGVEASRSPVLDAGFREAEAAIEDLWGEQPLFLREGGSVPIIAEIRKILGIDSIMIGMFTPTSNLHAPNENLHLGMFCKGITASARIFRAMALIPGK